MYQPWALSPNTADSVYCSVSNLLTGCRSKSCSPGVILCQIACCYFCGKMCFTVSPNVNMLKMVITCHRRTWWLVVLVRKAVPDKSDTSTQPVCVRLLSAVLCHTMVLTFIAFLVAVLVISTCLLDAFGGISSFHYIEIRLAAVERNQTNFVCDRKNVVIFTKTCFIGSVFQFSSLLL